jgi:Ca2+-binding EF-hand superfamily protein
MGCISSSEAYEAMIKRADFKVWMTQFETMGLNGSDIKRLFQVFEIIDQDHSNSIGLPELLAHIDLPRTDFTEKIFCLFDNDQSGAIDFREFVLSVWNYCTLSKVNLG